MSSMDETSENLRKRREPKKITEKYLKNSALYYLQRYASSSANLKSVLMRRVRRSSSHHGTSVEEGAELLDGVVAWMEELGLLNDAAFAEAQAASLHRRGTSRRAIRMKLFQKGLGEEDIDAALSVLEVEFENVEFAAAGVFARKRRLGPYRDEDARKDLYEKDLAALARAGFSYDIAKQVVETETREELEAERTL